MSTTVTKTIKSAGGDYSSLSNWEATEQGDLVAADEIRQAECYAFQDTTAFTIDGSTTDATRYLRIYAAAGCEAGMPWRASTDAYQLSPAGSGAVPRALYVSDSYTRVERIQIEVRGNAVGASLSILYTDQPSRFLGCYFRQNGTDTGGYGRGGVVFEGEAIVVNCVCADVVSASGSPGDAFHAADPFTGVRFYNCTAVNSDRGFRRNAGTAVAKNCLAYNNSGLDFSGTFDAASDYNASEDTTAPGTNARVSQTFAFVNAAGGDWHLAIGDAGAKDFGTDLSADANYAFNDDFDGVIRASLWDIGADEVSGVGTPVGFIGTKRVRSIRGPFDRLGFLRRRTWESTIPASPFVQQEVAASGVQLAVGSGGLNAFRALRAAGIALAVASASMSVVRDLRASEVAVSAGAARGAAVRNVKASDVALSAAAATPSRVRQTAGSGSAESCGNATAGRRRPIASSSIALSVGHALATAIPAGTLKQLSASGVSWSAVAARQNDIRGLRASGASDGVASARLQSIDDFRASAIAGSRGTASASAVRGARASAVTWSEGQATPSALRNLRASGIAISSTSGIPGLSVPLFITRTWVLVTPRVTQIGVAARRTWASVAARVTEADPDS